MKGAYKYIFFVLSWRTVVEKLRYNICKLKLQVDDKYVALARPSDTLWPECRSGTCRGCFCEEHFFLEV